MLFEIRSVLLVLLVALMIVGGYHRARAVQANEWLDRRQEGWPILIGLRLTAFVLLLINVAWFWNARTLDWASLGAPLWIRWIGVMGFALSNGWLFWMYHSLGRNITDTVVTRDTAVFVESGPYRYVRNPMYTGLLIWCISLGVAEGNWLVPLGGCLVFAILAARTATEERFLVARFGDQYRSYMLRVGRFWPRLGN